MNPTAQQIVTALIEGESGGEVERISNLRPSNLSISSTEAEILFDTLNAAVVGDDELLSGFDQMEVSRLLEKLSRFLDGAETVDGEVPPNVNPDPDLVDR
jgi:hypothetical protein